MKFEPLLWEELIKFDIKLELKERPIIIVELDDNLNRRYNAVVVKYDTKKNVHIRYLDNPYYPEKYWWTGNKDNFPGLDPRCYHAKFLGDKIDDMEGLRRVDFQENGYDDIINYERESHRFFKGKSFFPYLNGLQGNINVNNYYTTEYNNTLIKGEIPECIKNKLPKNKEYKLNKIENEGREWILYILLENLPLKYSPIIKDYHKDKENEEILNNFMILLSYKITNKFIEKYSNELNMTDSELNSIKYDLRKGMISSNFVKLVPYLTKYNIKIFDCNNNDLEIKEYEGGDKNRFIYLLKYLNDLYLL